MDQYELDDADEKLSRFCRWGGDAYELEEEEPAPVPQPQPAVNTPPRQTAASSHASSAASLQPQRSEEIKNRSNPQSGKTSTPDIASNKSAQFQSTPAHEEHHETHSPEFTTPKSTQPPQQSSQPSNKMNFSQISSTPSEKLNFASLMNSPPKKTNQDPGYVSRVANAAYNVVGTAVSSLRSQANSRFVSNESSASSMDSVGLNQPRESTGRRDSDHHGDDEHSPTVVETKLDSFFGGGGSSLSLSRVSLEESRQTLVNPAAQKPQYHISNLARDEFSSSTGDMKSALHFHPIEKRQTVVPNNSDDMLYQRSNIKPQTKQKDYIVPAPPANSAHDMASTEMRHTNVKPSVVNRALGKDSGPAAPPNSTEDVLQYSKNMNSFSREYQVPSAPQNSSEDVYMKKGAPLAFQMHQKMPSNLRGDHSSASNDEHSLQQADSGKKSYVYKNSAEEEQNDHAMWGGGGSSFSLSCLENEKAPHLRRHEPLPNDASVSDLMYKIGRDNGWAIDEIEEDIKTLRKNRLRTIKDLRTMSEYGWSELKELLPIVKDRLRAEAGVFGGHMDKSGSRADSIY